VSYEVEGAETPTSPVCGGDASFDAAAATATVAFDCTAAH
jgi:hypothetical protein